MSYTPVSFEETIRPMIAIFDLNATESAGLARVIVGVSLYRDLGSKDQSNYLVPIMPQDILTDQRGGYNDADELRAGLPDLVIVDAKLYGVLEGVDDLMPVVLDDNSGEWVIG